MRLDLNGLADASREALMSEWRAVVGRPPPKHLSKPPYGADFEPYLPDGGAVRQIGSSIRSLGSVNSMRRLESATL